jgi:hypothetical protein
MEKYKKIKTVDEYEDFVSKFVFYIDNELTKLEDIAKNKRDDDDAMGYLSITVPMLCMALETLDAMYSWGVPIEITTVIDKSKESSPYYLSNVLWGRLNPLREVVKESGRQESYANEFEKFL